MNELECKDCGVTFYSHGYKKICAKCQRSRDAHRNYLKERAKEAKNYEGPKLKLK